MSTYNVVVKKSALKELKKLPKPTATRISILLKELAKDPRPSGCKKLKSYNNLWRVRTGNYRIIYTIEEQVLIVEVLEIGDRKAIYRR